MHYCNTCKKEKKICVQKPPCGCPIPDLSTDCVVYGGEPLECSGIETPDTLTQILYKLDNFICEKFASTLVGKLINIGQGSRLFKQLNNAGRQEIRTLTSEDESVTIEEKENTIDFSVAEIPTSNSKVIGFRVDPNTKSEIISEVNGTSQFTLDNPENTLVKASFVTEQGVTPFQAITKIYQIITETPIPSNNVTAGLFGNGGQDLTNQNLELIETYESTVQDLTQIEGTEVFDLGNIGNVSVVNYISDVSPSLTFDNPNTNLNIITATTNGVLVSYLYIGLGGTYGTNDDPLGLDEMYLIEQDNPTTNQTLSPEFLNISKRQTIDMSNVLGNYYNLTSATTYFEFFLGNKVPGGKAIVRTNANTLSDPSLVTLSETGDLKKSLNSEWQDNTDMDIEIFVRGDLTVEWSFKPTVNQ